jgi:hypothetical protein
MRFSIFVLALAALGSGWAQQPGIGRVILEPKIQPGSRDTVWQVIKGQDTLFFDYFPDLNDLAIYKQKVVKVPYEPKSDAFLDRYMKLVFRKSEKPDSLNYNRMRYWKEPLRIFFDSSVTEGHRKLLIEFAERLDREVDSLAVRFVDTLTESNYVVYFNDEEHKGVFDPDLVNFHEGYRVYWKGGRIYQGFLKIDRQVYRDPDVVNKLLLHRFFLSLGYFLPSGELPCSDYLSSCFSSSKALSESDLEILKYHYSYGICKGTRVVEFLEQHRQARASLAKNPTNQFYFVHLQ